MCNILQLDKLKSAILIVLEEHHVVVGEPGGYYLTHLTAGDAKGQTIANKLYENLANTELKDKLLVVGTDGTASMTGPHSGFIRCLEVILKRPLQRSICLLHGNELPLRHVFTSLDGVTNGPDSFSGPIGKQLNTCVSEWPVVNFTPIKCPELLLIPQAILEDISDDQHYGYLICLAVSSGSVDENLKKYK